MTSLMICLTVLTGAFLAALILRREDEPTFPRQPQVETLVISKDYAQACQEVERIGLRGDWRFVWSAAQLYGYLPGDVKIQLLGEYARSPIWEDPDSITMLKYLGLSVFDPFETVADGVLPS